MTDDNVISLGRRAFADAPPHHPALRWLIDGADERAHRRRDGAAVCGRAGLMTLATKGDPLCRECFPQTG